MAPSPRLSVALALAAAAAAAAAPVADAAFCASGILSDDGEVCCAASCGACGGAGCGTRPGGGSACCASTIKDTRAMCKGDQDTACNVPQGSHTDRWCYAGVVANDQSKPRAGPADSMEPEAGDACCPAACGTCGGRGCSTRPGGPFECCARMVTLSGRKCVDYEDTACVVPDLSPPVIKESGSWFTGLGNNYCHQKKPIDANNPGDGYFNNTLCMEDNVIQVLEQSGINVTEGYQGEFDVDDRVPILDEYFKNGLCPVNVHWHLGTEHLSVGQYDEGGSGPHGSSPYERRRRSLLGTGYVRGGYQCHHYDGADPRFTTEYAWEHCVGMHVGDTYEVHWPHSAAGACGTPHQYQTPFYDGVFCNDGIISLDPLNTYQKIGVQAQIFTIINDEAYYYPDLIRGMVVDGPMGSDVAKYTGSTTGTSRDNVICSRYTPITWQVDRKCHLISASAFDKMCADMKAQRDDMTDDLHAHGSRELVADYLAANRLWP